MIEKISDNVEIVGETPTFDNGKSRGSIRMLSVYSVAKNPVNRQMGKAASQDKGGYNRNPTLRACRIKKGKSCGSG